MTKNNAEFLKDFLNNKNFNNIEQIVVINPDIIEITINNSTEKILVLSETQITKQSIQNKTIENIQFICNIPKKSVWAEDILEMCATQRIGYGNIGDLMSALSEHNQKSINLFYPKEFQFIDKSLSTHSNVASYSKITNRVYRINLKNNQSKIVIFLKEYELTGEHIIDAKQLHGSFDIIAINDPNGKATTHAKNVAKDLDIILIETWRNFFGFLKNPS